MVWFFNNSVKNEAVITVILGFFPFKTDNNFILTPSLHSEEVFEFLTPSQVVFPKQWSPSCSGKQSANSPWEAVMFLLAE